MRSCLVFGAGCEGTGRIVDALIAAKYGDSSVSPSASPSRLFEAVEVRGINESLIQATLRAAPQPEQDPGQLHLFAPGSAIVQEPGMDGRMRSLVAGAPFCFEDLRFAFTLPAWRMRLPGDLGLLCSFRHPSQAASNLVRQYTGGSSFADGPLSIAGAFELWIATYERILDEHANSGDWLFLHDDQLNTRAGWARLGEFLDVTVQDSTHDGEPAGDSAEFEVPERALELYAELQRRAGHQTRGSASANERRVAVLAWITPEGREHVADIIEDARLQENVEVDLILLDATGDGLEVDGATVVPACWSRGASYRAALEHSDASHFALVVPGTRSSPTRLSLALDALTGADMVSADFFLAGAEGDPIGRVSPKAMGDVPGPYFEAGLVMRRAALLELAPTAFFPVELELFRALRREGRVAHVTEPAFAVARDLYTTAWDRAQDDARIVTLAAHPEDRPRLTVSLCSSGRGEQLRECLEGLARQLLAPGAFEVVLSDRGPLDAAAEALGALQFPVPFKLLASHGQAVAAARDAGLAQAEGDHVLFLADDSIPAPDLIERHLARHASLIASGDQAAVLGAIESPRRGIGGALGRYLSDAEEPGARANMDAREGHHGLGPNLENVSVSAQAVRAAGGLGAVHELDGHEFSELGLRLGSLGCRGIREPGARVVHRRPPGLDCVKARAHAEARAYVRLARGHAGLLDIWERAGWTAAACERELGRRHDAGPELEDVARELSQVDVEALTELDGPYKELAEEVRVRLAELMPQLERAWWLEGLVEAMAEQDLSGYQELIDEGAELRRPGSGSMPGSEPGPAEAAAPELSVIIPTRDRPRELLQVLEALRGQGLAHQRFEVLVIDDGSKLEVSELVDPRGFPFHLELLRQDPAGPGAARDQGVARARGDLIVFFNDDAVPARDNLERHMAAHAATEELVAVLGTFNLQARHICDSFAVHVETSTALFAQPCMRAGVRYHGLSLSTGNVSLPRKALEAVGGFDQELAFAGGEDSELGCRLERALGLRVVFDPKVRAEHDHAPDVAGFARRRRVVGWSAYRIQKLHPVAGLFTVDSWSDLAEEVNGADSQSRALVQRLEEICKREACDGVVGGAKGEVSGLAERIGELEFRAGLLLAHHGLTPGDPLPAASEQIMVPITVLPCAGSGSAGATGLICR